MNRKTQKRLGGSGASQYAEYVYGSPSEQQPEGVDSNRIAIQNDPKLYTPVTGGKSHHAHHAASHHSMRHHRGGKHPAAHHSVAHHSMSHRHRGGKSLLVELGVPAALIYANNTVRKNSYTQKNKNSRKFRFTRKQK